MPPPCLAAGSRAAGGRAATRHPAHPARCAAQSVQLPNGLSLRVVSRRDVPFLWQEIWQRRCYLRHGIRLPPGGAVIDVGANVGLFTLLAAQEMGPEGLVIACEPMPDTFECLTHNVERHRRWWQAQQGQQQGQRPGPGRGGGAPAPVVALNVGVGSGAQAAATFTFYPRAAGWSSMRPAEGQVESDMRAFLAAALASPEASAAAGLGPRTAALGRWLRAAAPRWAYDAAARTAVRALLGAPRALRCPLVTVSQLVRQHGLGAVDLLKVDAERAELEVLRGVEARHWPLVRQAALEVHGEQLEEALALLRGPAGFARVAVEQEAALAGTSLHAVYCTR